MSYCAICEGKDGICKYHLLIKFLNKIDTDKYGKVKTEETMTGWRDYLVRDGEEIKRRNKEKIKEIFEEINKDLSEQE